MHYTSNLSILALLSDAGLYEEGMGLEEKRTMLQLLEESRASAQQEAKEREQWRQQEEQILNETLNKSFKDNSEVCFSFFFFTSYINEKFNLASFQMYSL